VQVRDSWYAAVGHHRARAALTGPHRQAGRHGRSRSEWEIIQGGSRPGRAVARAGSRAPRSRHHAAAHQQHEFILEPTEYADVNVLVPKENAEPPLCLTLVDKRHFH
jgi:hypothetical protein